MSQVYSPLGSLISPGGNEPDLRTYTCLGCGSVVYDMATHDRWHREVYEHRHTYQVSTENHMQGVVGYQGHTGVGEPIKHDEPG